MLVPYRDYCYRVNAKPLSRVSDVDIAKFLDTIEWKNLYFSCGEEYSSKNKLFKSGTINNMFKDGLYEGKDIYILSGSGEGDMWFLPGLGEGSIFVFNDYYSTLEHPGPKSAPAFRQQRFIADSYLKYQKLINQKFFDVVFHHAPKMLLGLDVFVYLICKYKMIFKDHYIPVDFKEKALLLTKGLWSQNIISINEESSFMLLSEFDSKLKKNQEDFHKLLELFNVSEKKFLSISEYKFPRP